MSRMPRMSLFALGLHERSQKVTQAWPESDHSAFDAVKTENIPRLHMLS